KNDHLDALVAFLCRMVRAECHQAGLRCRIDAALIDDCRVVPSERRHNIVLALREAVHNALKHAAAGELALTVKFAHDTLTVTLADNGRGFTVSAAGHNGNGLANMKSRLEKFHGALSIVSVSGGGATVRFSIPIPNGKQS
ncbi:MAG: ATP-binding protein, partial [Verrucomicrobiales bacterium]|nr:ATP-binding protein [Verrucomicrobiales bacterium]